MQADNVRDRSTGRQYHRLAPDSAMLWLPAGPAKQTAAGRATVRNGVAKLSSVLVVGIVLAIALMAVIPHVFSMALTPSAVQYVEVTVMPGQTLWEIASEYKAERTDTRRMVDRIRAVNELSNASVYPGQVLRIPVAP